MSEMAAKESCVRSGPLYVHKGFVLGHEQDEVTGWYYLNRIEIVRPAGVLERFRWALFKTPPDK